MEIEIYVRLGFFFGVFALMSVWELLAPRRTLNTSKARRWANNLGIVALNTAVVRVFFSAGATGFAVMAREQGWGMLATLEPPYAMRVAFSVLALDFIIYVQHRIFHLVPLLWRLHMVHHTDLDYDVTTGARFHPVEIMLSMLIKIAAIFLLGAPALAVLIFEVALNATAMFNHGNVGINQKLDRFLRLVVVTPDMHRVHHSAIISEHNANFGFNAPWWDYLFGTYSPRPFFGHQGMRIGLANFRDAGRLDLWSLLVMPFRRRRHWR